MLYNLFSVVGSIQVEIRKKKKIGKNTPNFRSVTFPRRRLCTCSLTFRCRWWGSKDQEVCYSVPDIDIFTQCLASGRFMRGRGFPPGFRPRLPPPESEDTIFKKYDQTPRWEHVTNINNISGLMIWHIKSLKMVLYPLTISNFMDPLTK